MATQSTRATNKPGSKKLLWIIGIAVILVAAIAIAAVAASLLIPAGNETRYSLSPNELTLSVGETEHLQVVSATGGGAVAQVNWSSSAPSVVAVDESGTITAMAVGEAKISAVITEGEDEYLAVAQITVTGGQEGSGQISIDGAEVPKVERQFMLSQKNANVSDEPVDGIIRVSDSIKDTCMVFAAGQGTGLHSKAWELSGTVTKEKLDVPLFISFGVIDQDGKEQWFCILDDGMSLQRYWNWWDTKYDRDGNHVVKNQIAEDFFYRRRLDLSFRIVVKDDILRAYFGETVDTAVLTWELPLTEEIFGGFAAGSEYQLAINTVDPNNLVYTDVKTVVGDEVEFDDQQMPGPYPNILYVWDGNVSFKAGIGQYVMGAGDATAMTGSTYTQGTLGVNFCPDVWPIQGFSIRQGDNKVTFKFGSEGYDSFAIATYVNGKAGDVLSTAFSYSMYGAYKYTVLMAFDGEYINFLTYRNGGLRAINAEPVSLAELLGEDWVPGEGIAMGIAGFSGCGRQFDNIWISENVFTAVEEDPNAPKDLGPLPVMTGNVFYDASSGMYVMTDGSPTAVTEETYGTVELSANFCPSTWPIQGFALKQGDNMATVRFGSEGYSTGVLTIALNGEDVGTVPTAYGFSLYGYYNYDMKLTYDGTHVNTFLHKDGTWTQVNKNPIPIKDIFGSSYVEGQEIAVGVAGFSGCGRQFKDISLSEEITVFPVEIPVELGPLPVHSGEIAYDPTMDMYIMGSGSPTAMTDKTYTEVELSAVFCPDVWPIQGYVMKQGENTITFQFGSEGYDSGNILVKVNGKTVSNPQTAFAFSLVGAYTYNMKLIYDGENVDLLLYQNDQWVRINKDPMNLAALIGSGADPDQPVAVGIAGFNGCGRQIKNITVADKITTKPGDSSNEDTWDHFGESQAKNLYTEYAGRGTDGETTIFVGDSFFDKSFWKSFAEHLGENNALCMGIGGSTAEDWLEYLNREIFMHDIKPKNIVFNLGNNDLHNDGDLNKYLNNMKKLLEDVHARTPDTKLFMFSVAHRTGAGTNGIVDEANSRMKQWCEEQGWVVFVDISDQLTTDMLFDGIHPSEQYYATIYLPALIEAGCELEIGEVPGLVDVLPVHNGDITFDPVTGKYSVGEGDAYAITDKAYPAVDLTVTFCPDVWPIQGFVVKNGDNLAEFWFGSEGYDSHHIMGRVNGQAFASNPATAFNFSLVGAYSYEMKLSYDGTNLNMYVKQDGAWTQINKDPINLAVLIGSGYNAEKGLQVGIGGFKGCGRQFSNAAVTETEPVKPTDNGPLSVLSGNVTYDPATGMYVMGEGNATAVTEKSYQAVEMDVTFCPHTWPIQGFAIKNGDNMLTINTGSEGYDPDALFIKLNGTSVSHSITNVSGWTPYGDRSYDLKLISDGTAVNIQINQNGQWTQINSAPIVLADVFGAGYDADAGIQVGVAGFSGCGREFKNIVVTEKEPPAPPVDNGPLSVLSGDMAYDGNYTLPEQKAGSAMTAESYAAVELKVTHVNTNWPNMAFQLGNGTDHVRFAFGSSGYDNENLIVKFNGTNAGTVAATNSSLKANNTYNLVLVFDGTHVNIYFEDAAGTRTRVNNEPIVLADYLSHDAAQGVSVGLYAGDTWGLTTFSNVAVTKQEPVQPEVDNGPLSVLSGNVTYDPATGMYVMTDGSPTAMTEKSYQAVELTANFCPHTWPVQGFVVKNGDNVVTFQFGSEGYDTHLIMTKVNGTGVAANPATAFAFSLVGAYSYDLKLDYDGTNLNMYLNENGTWKQINKDPIDLAALIGSGFDAEKGLQVGIAGFSGCGREFKNIVVTEKEPPAPPVDNGPLSVLGGDASYNGETGVYSIPTGSAMTPDAYKTAELKVTFNTTGWPMQGFVVKQGDNEVKLQFGSCGYDNHRIMISGATAISEVATGFAFSPAANTIYNMKLTYDGVNLNLFVKQGSSWRQINAAAIAMADLMTGFDAEQGIQVGVAGFSGCGDSFSNVSVQDTLSTIEQTLPTLTGNATYDKTAGSYTMTDGTAVSSKLYESAELESTFVTGGWPIMGFVVKQGDNEVKLKFGSCGYDSDKIMISGATGISQIATAFAFSPAANTTYDMKLTYDGVNLNVYVKQDSVWSQINAAPIAMSELMTGFDAEQGVQVGVAGFSGCGGIFINVAVSGTEFAPPVDNGPLSVLSGNVTYDPATGMYVMTADSPTAMTEKSYQAVELTANFCPHTWPVQGFVVKNGDNVVSFMFGSEGYDTHHIMTKVNGTGVAANPATAFAFSLVGAYSYDLKLVFDGTNLNMYLNENGTWKQINKDPIDMAALIGSGYNAEKGLQVGIAGFNGCGREFKNIVVTGVAI